ncbi:hypothetical protein KHY18_23715 [Acidovorax sp. CCYZU-2555]|nr:hypothetical protein [Acidovorax sp. CCYZU-2555]MBS7781010.1 hypothetical protein [Acidovorax sp. CCYZU-2555]
MSVRKPRSSTPKAPAASAPTSAATAPTPAPAVAPAPVASDTQPKKPKLVRDSFTIPKDEYEAIDGLKRRAALQGEVVKKSELLRAGIKLLSGLDDKQLLVALHAVPSIKTGRPAKTEEAPIPPVKTTRRSSAKAKK